jgi:hypothetical protein
MKRLLAALFATAATAASAQVPPLDCGAVPEYPGRLGSDRQKQSFDKAYKVYDKCVRDYVEQRKAQIKLNEEAAQKAIDDYNVLVTKMRADSGEDPNKGKSAPVEPPKK